MRDNVGKGVACGLVTCGARVLAPKVPSLWRRWLAPCPTQHWAQGLGIPGWQGEGTLHAAAEGHLVQAPAPAAGGGLGGAGVSAPPTPPNSPAQV